MIEKGKYTKEMKKRRDEFNAIKSRLEDTVSRLDVVDINQKHSVIDYGALWRMSEGNNAWYRLVPMYAVETDFDFIIGILKRGYFNVPFKTAIHRTINVLEGEIDNQGKVYSRGSSFEVPADEYVQTKANKDSILIIQIAYNSNSNRLLKVGTPGTEVVRIYPE